MNNILSLEDVQNCSYSVGVFYDLLRPRIAAIISIDQRNHVLDEMQAEFERRVRQEPEIRDMLSDIYNLLKHIT